MDYAELLHEEQTQQGGEAEWEDELQSVAASFELSYRRLPAAVQQLFATLCIFAGPDFGNEAVAAIAGVSGLRAQKALGQLHALSLIDEGFGQRQTLMPIPTEEQIRFRLHPLLKVYTAKKLGDAREERHRRAAEYYAELVCKTGSRLAILDLISSGRTPSVSCSGPTSSGSGHC